MTATYITVVVITATAIPTALILGTIMLQLPMGKKLKKLMHKT